jgi:N-methylhydantoinase A
MKYSLQVYEVEVEIPDGDVDEACGRGLMANFQRTYESRYGRGSGYAEAGAVLTAVRVVVRDVSEPQTPRRPPVAEAAAEPDTTRPVYWSELGRQEATPIYDGLAVRSGATIAGPAIAEYPNTTIAVRPEQSLRADEFGNLILRLRGE